VFLYLTYIEEGVKNKLRPCRNLVLLVLDLVTRSTEHYINIYAGCPRSFANNINKDASTNTHMNST
jgi:hypothetical protein